MASLLRLHKGIRGGYGRMVSQAPVGEQVTHGDELQRLCGELASIFRRAWGRGPVRTTARWAGRNMLVVLLENGHTDAEKTLRAAGHIQQLVGGRELLQNIIEDELEDAVERITGRRVRTMLSATRLDPDLSAEVFLLEPDAAGAEGEHDASLAGRMEDARSRSAELADESRALGAQGRQIQHRHEHARDDG